MAYLSYINNVAKSKILKTGLDIDLESCSKDNLKIFIAICLYSGTLLDAKNENLISKLASQKSLFVKNWLTLLKEEIAVSVHLPQSNIRKVQIQHHVFWLIYLTPCYRFNSLQGMFEIKKIKDPINLIQWLWNCLTNREFDDYYRQIEQDYIICIYLFYLFKELDEMIKNKKISKMKVNSMIWQEIDLIVQIAVNVCRSFYSNEEESQLSDLAHEEFDTKVEHLVYILVNISDHPSEYTRYFSQTLVFELESKGFSVIKHFVDIIKEIDEGVLTNLIDLSFKEDVDKYQIFSILFKLVKQSEDTELLESESEMSSYRSNDSFPQGSLLASISSKRNIIMRAILLAIYKSFSSINDIQVIARLFFMIFIPYAFKGTQARLRVAKYLDEVKDTDDIEQIVVSLISDSDLNPSTAENLDKFDTDTEEKGN